MSKKNGKKRIGLWITLGILGAILVAIGGNTIGNAFVRNQLVKYANTFDEVQYTNQLVPSLDIEGDYCFTTDNNFKVMQLTDIHIGGGTLSVKKDKMALNAVAAMITYEKPDLVVVTGDISFAVPYIAGTINNKNAHDAFSTLMNKLGVYWTVIFGNHDSEAYDFYNRNKVAKMYESDKYTKCIYKAGPNDINGRGNQVIKIKKTNGLINKALFTIDSNSYLSSDPFGIKWQYDNVHQDQIDWYSNKIDEMSDYNNSVLTTLGSSVTNTADFTVAQSFIFQHIPVSEYYNAYSEYVENGNTDTSDSKYLYGEMGEDPSGKMVYGPINSDQFFETMLEKGSTKAMYCGHDHLNNFGFRYKGIELSYGMSIDYLAYTNIHKYGRQRGCSLIMVNSDSTYETLHENYYDGKYLSKYAKEEVTMDTYYKVD